MRLFFFYAFAKFTLSIMKTRYNLGGLHMKMFRKNLTIEMANDGTLAVDKLVGIFEALTKNKDDITIVNAKSLDKIYVTVRASIFEYWKIKKIIKKRYPGVCECYY